VDLAELPVFPTNQSNQIPIHRKTPQPTEQQSLMTKHNNTPKMSFDMTNPTASIPKAWNENKAKNGSNVLKT